ncbi:MAG: Uma2 family endonuclease [Synechococcaceae cyanobacterium SM2_3_1]|nr:Uma2 family endonuclease [Synechococcaceae cyanobacterium SM2_3_1]
MTQMLTSTTIPPLESGDHLSRREFERRYHAMPHLKKAELIEGVVFVASPLRFHPHAKPHAQIMTWLGTYAASTTGVEVGDNPTVQLDLDNEPQPDAVLFIASGGQSRINTEGYIEGAPELVVEVAASSASHDLHAKKTAYRRNGVQEYIVWQVMDQKITWFKLIEDAYIEQVPDGNGILDSSIFLGLWLDVNALLQDDMSKVLSVLQQGIQSQEHQALVQRLNPDS